MYIRYLQVFRKLEDCYHQLLQPQKRAEVRLILDACIGRMLELKFQIVRHCGEYINYDDALVDLKLTPDVLEIPIPRCASPPPMVALLKCTIPPPTAGLPLRFFGAMGIWVCPQILLGGAEEGAGGAIKAAERSPPAVRAPTGLKGSPSPPGCLCSTHPSTHPHTYTPPNHPHTHTHPHIQTRTDTHMLCQSLVGTP